jgi:hypothetical protein
MDLVGGRDRLRQLLILGMLAGLGMRVTVFHAGGWGGIASGGLFWTCAVASVCFGLHQVIARVQRGSEVPDFKWILLTLGVAAFLLGVISDDAGSLFRPITLICVLISAGLGLRDLASGGGAARPGEPA